MTFEAEGNKGGDYLRLRLVKENLVDVEVGHCCVVTVRKRMPVEILTAIISTWQSFDLPWEDEVNDALLSQVSETELSL